MVADDLVPVLLAAAKGEALPTQLRFHDGAAIVIVLAAGGYPGSYAKGKVITFPENLPNGGAVVHAGTSRDADGTIRTSGGRVLGVSAQATSLQEAAELAYSVCDQIDFEDKYLRRDIGHRELNR
jgi:phosphoribosylamine-glycine ligase